MLQKKYHLLCGLISLSSAILYAEEQPLTAAAESQAKPYTVQAARSGSSNQMQQKHYVPEFDMGDPIVTGQPGKPNYIPAAYNYPAGIRCPNQDWDMYFTGAFTWWKVHQDNMFTGIGTNATVPALVTSGFAGTTELNNEIFTSRKPGYKPGFKVGLGWNTGSWDNWTLNAEYTWFHPGSGKDDADDDCGECGCATQILLVPTCGCPDGLIATNLESTWKPRLDIVDVNVGRPAYQGKHLVMNPFFGLRALWIRQNWKVEYDAAAPNGQGVITPMGEYEKKAHSKAWSLGPRVGVDGNWLFGAGFRMIGNASASLLYTRYTKLTYSSNIPNGLTTGAAGTPLVNPVDWKYAKSYGTVRPNFEIDAGLAWGMYIGDCYRFDLAATYDFHTFFAQNMSSVIENEAVHYADTSPGNLYIHGLTIKLRFDF